MDDLIDANTNNQRVHFFAEIGSFQSGEDSHINKDAFLGEGLEKPKPIHPPEEGFVNRVSAEAFGEVKLRTEKSSRIAFDLSGQHGEPTKKAREKEIREIEAKSRTKAEDLASPLGDIILDTRGYDVLRFKQKYIDPQGNVLVEDSIGFTMANPDDEIDYLRLPNGRAASVNASLFAQRLESRKHNPIEGASVRMIPRVNGEGQYNGTVTFIENGAQNTAQAEQQQKEQEKPRVKSFKTAKDSIYTYDQDGKTTRFKTATGEQEERQDLTVFVDLNPDEAQQVLHANYHPGEGDQGSKIYVVERQEDNSVKRLRDISEVGNPDEVRLVIVKNGKYEFVKPVSLEPRVGYGVFDTRQYVGEDGKIYTERHLGNKVAEIEYEKN